MGKPIFILNGPSLNLLGTREPEIYGTTTLAEVEAMCHARAVSLGLGVAFRQTNHEAAFLAWMHEAITGAAGLIINPGAWTFTSVALRDALAAVPAPIIELHITNLQTREEFRHHSLIAPVATATIAGLGVDGYAIAVAAMAHRLARAMPPAEATSGSARRYP